MFLNDYDDTPTARAEPSVHPLALDLSERLRPSAADRSRPRVLLLGIGSGRNVSPLARAGLDVCAVEDDRARAGAASERFAGVAGVTIVHGSYAAPLPFSKALAGALSTHALLHGTPEAIAASVGAVARGLESGAPFYATLGSTSDPRFGRGEPLGATTFAPTAGSERGVAHSYFDEAGARVLFGAFEIESLEETGGGRNVGRWAHDDAESLAIVHWYVRATLRSSVDDSRRYGRD